MRDNYRNKENLRTLCLEALNNKTDEKILILNKPHVDQSLFKEGKPVNGMCTKTSKQIEDEYLTFHLGQEDYN